VEQAKEREYADLAQADLILVLDQAGRYSQALREYEVFRRKYPSPSLAARSAALGNVVSVYRHLNQEDKAKAAARKWVRATPPGSMEHQWAAETLRSLEEGRR
jgi:outer membrane protein assembly factor BamD (BamD/ComL family)